MTDVPALSTNPSDYNVGPGADPVDGFQFEVLQNVSVTALGLYVGSSSFTGNYDVDLWDSSGNLIASATVQPGDMMNGSFAFHSITPVTLLQGDNYIVEAQTDSGLVASETVPSDSRIQFVQDAFGSSLSYPNASDGPNFYIEGANLLLAPPFTETLADDTGLSSSDGVTSNPSLTGQADPGTTVTITEGSTQLGTTTADGSGNWSFTPTLADGPHTVVASETVGTDTSTTNLTFTLDTVAPVLPSNLELLPSSDSGVAGDQVTNATEPTLTGTAEANSLVTVSDTFGGSTVVLGTTTAGNDGHWSFTPGANLLDGEHSLAVTATDAAGNTSDAASFALTIDTTPSVMPIEMTLASISDTGLLGDDLTNITTPTITGTATVGDTVTLYDGESVVGSAVVGEDGAWAVTSSALAEGPHTLTATDTDNAGNASLLSDPLSIIIDTTASPAPAALTLAMTSDTGVVGDNVTSVVTPIVTGTATAGDTVTLYDGETVVGSAVVGEGGMWSVTSSALAEGPHTLTAVDIDPAGNASLPSDPLSVTVNGVTPTVTAVTLSSNDGTLTLGQAVTISLAMSEPVTVTDGAPSLVLSNGEVATYDAANSTPDGLVFDYTVAAGDDTAALSVASVNMNGSSLTDAAGNAASLSNAATLSFGSVAVHTGFNPFATLSVSNPDPNAIVTVDATVPGVSGIFTHLGIGSIDADGVTYTVTGTAAQVNAALASVLLSPTDSSASFAGVSASLIDADPSQPGQLNNTSSLGSVLTATIPGERLQGDGGSDTLIGMATNVVIHAGSGPTTVISAAGGTTLIGLGDGPAVVNAQGADTIVGGSGTAVINAAANSFIGLNSGNATVTAGQGSMIIGGTGEELVVASGSGVLLFSGAGDTTFVGGTGSSTVVGGSGHSTIFGGAGGGLFAGGTGGDNVIVGGTQATTIFGGGNGDVLYAMGSAGTTLAAGAGNETLVGGYSSGNDTFFAGSGNDLIGLGSGSDVVFAGTGSSTVVAGQGTDIFAFTNGQAGGSETIFGFKLGTDQLSLQGYASGELQRDLASAVTKTDPTSGVASTTLTLSDHTQITLAGVTSASARLI